LRCSRGTPYCTRSQPVAYRCSGVALERATPGLPVSNCLRDPRVAGRETSLSPLSSRMPQFLLRSRRHIAHQCTEGWGCAAPTSADREAKGSSWGAVLVGRCLMRDEDGRWREETVTEGCGTTCTDKPISPFSPASTATVKLPQCGTCPKCGGLCGDISGTFLTVIHLPEAQIPFAYIPSTLTARNMELPPTTNQDMDFCRIAAFSLSFPVYRSASRLRLLLARYPVNVALRCLRPMWGNDTSEHR
jgi:hypothetical protein